MTAARSARLAACTAATVLLAGCSFFGSLFGPDKPKPKDLEPIAAPITVRSAWNLGVGAVEFPLTIAVNGNVLTARHDRRRRCSPSKPRPAAMLWRVNVGGKIAAGVGSDGTTSAVVTREGDLVALAGAQVKWKQAAGGARRDRAAGRRRSHLRARRRSLGAAPSTPPTASSYGSSSGPAIR